MLQSFLHHVFHCADPDVIGIVGAEKALMLSGHGPEEICIVTGGCDRGVIALWHFHQLILLDPVGLVDFSILGIEALQRKSLLRLAQEIVDLLQHAFMGHIVSIMLMRRETGPVSGGSIALANAEPLGIAASVNNEMGVSLPWLHAK